MKVRYELTKNDDEKHLKNYKYEKKLRRLKWKVYIFIKLIKPNNEIMNNW